MIQIPLYDIRKSWYEIKYTALLGEIVIRLHWTYCSTGGGGGDPVCTKQWLGGRVITWFLVVWTESLAVLLASRFTHWWSRTILIKPPQDKWQLATSLQKPQQKPQLVKTPSQIHETTPPSPPPPPQQEQETQHHGYYTTIRHAKDLCNVIQSKSRIQSLRLQLKKLHRDVCLESCLYSESGYGRPRVDFLSPEVA